jgi:hypothetical protein
LLIGPESAYLIPTINVGSVIREQGIGVMPQKVVHDLAEQLFVVATVSARAYQIDDVASPKAATALISSIISFTV